MFMLGSIRKNPKKHEQLCTKGVVGGFDILQEAFDILRRGSREDEMKKQDVTRHSRKPKQFVFGCK
jgi:hypothetical protein